MEPLNMADGGLVRREPMNMADGGFIGWLKDQKGWGREIETPGLEKVKNAAWAAVDFVPIVGDIKGAWELTQEFRKDPINWVAVGALTAGLVIALVPGIGDAIGAAIKTAVRKLGDAGILTVESLVSLLKVAKTGDEAKIKAHIAELTKQAEEAGWKVENVDEDFHASFDKDADGNIVKELYIPKGFSKNEYLIALEEFSHALDALDKGFAEIPGNRAVGGQQLVGGARLSEEIRAKVKTYESASERVTITSEDLEGWSSAFKSYLGIPFEWKDVTGYGDDAIKQLYKIPDDVWELIEFPKPNVGKLVARDRGEWINYIVNLNRNNVPLDTIAGPQYGPDGVSLATEAKLALNSISPSYRKQMSPDVKIGDPVPDDLGKMTTAQVTDAIRLRQSFTQGPEKPKAEHIPSGKALEDYDTSDPLEKFQYNDWKKDLFDGDSSRKATGSDYRDPNIERFIAPAGATPRGKVLKSHDVAQSVDPITGRPDLVARKGDPTKVTPKVTDKVAAAKQAANKVILEENVGLIQSLLRKNNINRDDWNDARSDAIIALFEAADKFRPGSNAKFSTYAYTKIDNAIKNRSGISNYDKRKAANEAKSVELDKEVEFEEGTGTANDLIGGGDIYQNEYNIDPTAQKGKEFFARFGDDAAVARVMAERASISRKATRGADGKVTKHKIPSWGELAEELGMSKKDFDAARKRISEKVEFGEYNSGGLVVRH